MRGLVQLRAALQAAAKQRSTGCSAAQAAWETLQRATAVTLARGALWAQAAAAARGPSQLPAWQQFRHASSDPHTSSAADGMSEENFHRIVDRTLDDLLERLEVFVDELDIEDADVEYSQGVLTMRLGELGTYVINKQTPNRQIWMSSPISGPVRYDWAPGKWVYQRDGHDMHSRLSGELKALTGEELDLSPCFACGKLNTCQGEQCDKGL